MITVPFPHLVRENLYLFVQFAFRQMLNKRLNTKQQYLEYLCHRLTQFADAEIHQLLINLPGRHLKTFICSVCLPAFMLGHDPDLKFLIVAYSEDIAEDIVRQIREFMSSKVYKKIFPTRIASGHARKNDFRISGASGRVRAAAVGSVTGKGGDILIFDDPHNVFDWQNARKKQKVIEAFEVLMTRRDQGRGSQVLVVGHRVAEDDLSAHIIERADFEHTCLPLFAPNAMEFELDGEIWKLAKGESLRGDAYPPDEINKIRAKHIGAPFWLHFQQGLGPKDDPLEIDVHHFPFFEGSYRGLPVVLSVDTTSKTASRSRNVIHVYAINGNSYVLLQAFAEACTFRRLYHRVRSLAEKYGASLVLVEDTVRGSDLIEKLEGNLHAQVEGILPQGTKYSRFRKFLPLIQAGRMKVKLGRKTVEEAIDEIVQFPNAAYTDHLDAMSQFLHRASQLSKRPLPLRRAKSRAVVGLRLGSRPPSTRKEVRGVGAAYGSAPGFGQHDHSANDFGRSGSSPYQAPEEPLPIVSGVPGGAIIKRLR
jgi:predicted phage terminase large subunit-like protein